MGCAERLEQDLGVARSHLTTRLLYGRPARRVLVGSEQAGDRKSTRLNSSHEWSSYAVFCLKKKKIAPCRFGNQHPANRHVVRVESRPILQRFNFVFGLIDARNPSLNFLSRVFFS